MTDLGFKPIFDAAQEVSKTVDYSEFFPTFHDHPELFHFIVAPKHQDMPDIRALTQALNIDSEIYHKLVNKGPSLVGNGSINIDGVESRHILLMTYLASKIGKDWGEVIEIGGGYGNLLRLMDGVINYTRWGIIDLDYISALQEWFLTSCRISLDNVYFLHSDIVPIVNPHLVLGTHSLSEISLDDFSKYYINIIKYSRWFFYVSQHSAPSKELLYKKLAIIDQNFDTYDRVEYEDGASIMYLFKHNENT